MFSYDFGQEYVLYGQTWTNCRVVYRSLHTRSSHHMVMHIIMGIKQIKSVFVRAHAWMHTLAFVNKEVG